MTIVGSAPTQRACQDIKDVVYGSSRMEIRSGVARPLEKNETIGWNTP